MYGVRSTLKALPPLIDQINVDLTPFIEPN
jgi:hypothetical protein